MLDKSENSEWVKIMNNNYSSLHNSIDKMQNSDLWKSYFELVKETHYEIRMLKLVQNLYSLIDNGLEERDTCYQETTDSIEFLLDYKLQYHEDLTLDKEDDLDTNRRDECP